MIGAKVGKFIKLLSSDQPGEVAAAASAINRALKSAGIDIHKLAEVVESQIDAPLAPRLKPATRPAHPAKRWTPPKTWAPKTPAFHPAAPFQMDQSIICDAPDGLFRACRCGSTRFTVLPGVGPHVAQLRCDVCKTGGRWLGRAHFGGA